MRSELVPQEIEPRVPLWRRGAAFAVDVFVVGLLSSILGRGAIAWVFMFSVTWLVLRVVLAVKNRGQTLGRWAFDVRLIDRRYGRGTPQLKQLTKREAIAGVSAMLAFAGLSAFSPSAAWALFLLLPLAGDCGLAVLDPAEQKAFHDQFAGTRVVASRHGYSLDLKLKRLLADLRKRVQR